MGKTTYRDAGVDIDAGEALVEKIKPMVRSTTRVEQMGGIGGFAGMITLPGGYKKPVIVAGCDGVGTKVLIAKMMQSHKTIGIDLVAMCVNDIMVCGAEPLFFLDYYACGSLDPDAAADVVAGIAEGCRRAGCSLLGGETAEMPGLYDNDEYDMAGFGVGVVEMKSIIDGTGVKPSDAVVGIQSSGLHSNGFSLVRKVLLDDEGLSLDAEVPELGRKLGDELLEPTIIYYKAVRQVIKLLDVKAIANITGGGMPGNIHRTIPAGLGVSVHNGSWDVPPVFTLIQKLGEIGESEMRRTFNMGIGMTLVVESDQVDEVVDIIASHDLRAWRIGTVIEKSSKKDRVVFE